MKQQTGPTHLQYLNTRTDEEMPIDLIPDLCGGIKHAYGAAGVMEETC